MTIGPVDGVHTDTRSRTETFSSLQQRVWSHW